MIKAFSEKFLINSFDAAPDGRAAPGALLRIMQECASRHAAQLGRGHQVLFEQNLMWVLTRLRLRFYSMPCWNDLITVKTWPSSAAGISFYREFIIEDRNGCPVLEADSAWSTVNFKEGKVCRVNVFPEFTDCGGKFVFAERPGRIRVPDGLEPGTEIQSRYFDLDMNNHVNNVRCFEFMLEYFDRDFLMNKQIADMQINYIGQIAYGDKLKVYGKVLDEQRFYLALYANEQNRPATVAEIKFKDCKEL
ncbi:MAG: acyl-ACP thioesterase domain-containing protein [Victivallales bacterium]